MDNCLSTDKYRLWYLPFHGNACFIGSS